MLPQMTTFHAKNLTEMQLSHSHRIKKITVGNLLEYHWVFLEQLHFTGMAIGNWKISIQFHSSQSANAIAPILCLSPEIDSSRLIS